MFSLEIGVDVMVDLKLDWTVVVGERCIFCGTSRRSFGDRFSISVCETPDRIRVIGGTRVRLRDVIDGH